MNFARIRAIAEEYQKNSRAPLGFLFRDLKTGQEIAYHRDEPFPTASTFKIFILAELFRRVEAGDCRLDDRHALTDEMKSFGSGVLACLDAGAALTLKDYATLMMIISDNTATDMLYDFVGGENIRKNVLEPLQLTHTRCDLCCKDLIGAYFGAGPGADEDRIIQDYMAGKLDFRNSPAYTCQAEKNDQTSPGDAARLLELIYRGQWVSPAASAGMLDIMKQCQTNSRIPRDIPGNVTIAHKTGTIDRFCADIGIVYAGDAGDYILCLFYNGNLASGEDYAADLNNRVGDPYLAKLSGEIYRAYTE